MRELRKLDRLARNMFLDCAVKSAVQKQNLHALRKDVPRTLACSPRRVEHESAATQIVNRLPKKVADPILDLTLTQTRILREMRELRIDGNMLKAIGTVIPYNANFSI